MFKPHFVALLYGAAALWGCSVTATQPSNETAMGLLVAVTGLGSLMLLRRRHHL